MIESCITQPQIELEVLSWTKEMAIKLNCLGDYSTLAGEGKITIGNSLWVDLKLQGC